MDQGCLFTGTKWCISEAGICIVLLFGSLKRICKKHVGNIRTICSACLERAQVSRSRVVVRLFHRSYFVMSLHLLVLQLKITRFESIGAGSQGVGVIHCTILGQLVINRLPSHDIPSHRIWVASIRDTQQTPTVMTAQPALGECHYKYK